MFGEQLLFFEGSEKKAEVLIDNSKLSLLNDISDEFWAQLVNCCNAQILSSIRNDVCKAFLLSESSLFVWDDRFLILTCGETVTVKSVEFFIEQVGMDKIEHVIYQRKNEYFAQAQLSSFGDDIRLLSEHMSGNACRFGELDGHHNYVFCQQNDYKADDNDKTYELLAYQISEQASKKLTSPGLSTLDIRQFLTLQDLLPNFVFDDFVFDPYGYSVNAICGKDYLTIHITPQQGSSYVSFESSINLIVMAPKLLSILKPASFDLLSFNEQNFAELTSEYISAEYVNSAKIKHTLDNGYFVCFANYILPAQQYSKPTLLDISGENNAL